MGIEEMPDGIRQDQAVIQLLRHICIFIGAAVAAEGGAQTLRRLVIGQGHDRFGLDIGHEISTPLWRF
jgi:hypothetical protein